MMIGENLKQLRENKDVSQKNVAKHINKSPQAYSQYEGNKRQPDAETLIQLADYYEVSVDYLLGRTKSKASPLSMRMKNNLYMLDVGDLTNQSLSKIKEYIDMLRKLEEK